jgi:hypothetical protein
MRKIFTTILIVLPLVFFALSSHAQQVLLFNENFNSGGGTFTLNGTGVGSNSGNNQWVVNSHYFPTNAAFDTTINEDQVCSNGAITMAPFSGYLHINNASLPTNGNSDYAPTNISDRFVYMTNGIATGADTVTVAFFYNCHGSSTAYAEFYYSKNNGPWIQAGQPKYNNNSACWQYETIIDSNFRNATSLQIGFRWVNDSTSTDTVSQGMSIDDVFIVGNSASGVEEIAGKSAITLFPNPATTLLNIHQSIPSPNQQLIITDLLGTEVYKEMLTGIDNTITISTWSAGLYFYEVRSNTGIARGKFVKE